MAEFAAVAVVVFLVLAIAVLACAAWCVIAEFFDPEDFD